MDERADFEIGHDFIQGLALGDDWQVDAFGNVILFAFVDMDLNDLFDS